MKYFQNLNKDLWTLSTGLKTEGKGDNKNKRMQ